MGRYCLIVTQENHSRGVPYLQMPNAQLPMTKSPKQPSFVKLYMRSWTDEFNANFGGQLSGFHLRSELVDVRFERVEFWSKFSSNYLWKANNSKVKALQHQNVSMMKELQTLRNEFSRLQASLRSHETEVSKHGGQSQPGPDPETTKTLQFVRDEYDDLTGFCKAFKKDLAAFKNRLESLTV